MKLTSIRLSTRITLLLLLLLVVGGLLWVGSLSSRLREDFLFERSHDLEVVQNVERERLLRGIETLRQDTVFLATTPPVSGIIRAKANRGIDPRDNNLYATWEQRLQEIFAAFLRAHPDYFQARYIGLDDNGRELVSVERLSGKITVTPRDELQAKGGHDYFKAAQSLRAREVYLSEINLNRVHEKIEVPHRPTLRAVTPVFNEQGKMFGVLVLNMDVSMLFAAAKEGLPPGVQAFIADNKGRYLMHPDAKRAFEFEFGGTRGITGDFPLLDTMFKSANHSSFHDAHQQDSGDRFAVSRVFYVPEDPGRYLVLAYRLPAEVIANLAYGIKIGDMLDGILILVVMGMMTAWNCACPSRRLHASQRLHARSRAGTGRYVLQKQAVARSGN